MTEITRTDLPDAPEPEHDSPNWGTNTKVIVAVAALVLLVAVTARFTFVIRMVATAAIIAYLMNPFIVLIQKHSRIKRGLAVLIVYLALILLAGTAVAILGAAAYVQVVSFTEQIPTLITRLTTSIETLSTQTTPIRLGPLAIAPAAINWEAISDQILKLVEPAAGKSYQLLSSAAGKTVSIVGNMFFVFILSIYLATEIPKLGGYVVRVARAPGYQNDARRLLISTSQVWSAYLRGQMLLGFYVGAASWLGLTVLGVQNAIALGILSGLLELVPNFGPIIAAVIAVLVAFLQTTPSHWAITNTQLALLTLGWMFIVQQLENNLLVPRIMGNALNLHPLLVLLGVLMGASLAGILGAVLAAPILATMKLLGVYLWRKMFDLPPFADPAFEPVKPRRAGPSLRERYKKWRSSRAKDAD
jgi:predicted PurR-regulated permease PerM